MVDIADLEEQAEADDPHAMWLLSGIYRNGWGGVEKDEAKAKELLERRIPILVVFADHGDLKAMDQLAYAYRMGWGVEKDEDKAKEWDEKWRSRAKWKG